MQTSLDWKGKNKKLSPAPTRSKNLQLPLVFKNKNTEVGQFAKLIEEHIELIAFSLKIWGKRLTFYITYADDRCTNTRNFQRKGASIQERAILNKLNTLVTFLNKQKIIRAFEIKLFIKH